MDLNYVLSYFGVVTVFLFGIGGFIYLIIQHKKRRKIEANLSESAAQDYVWQENNLQRAAYNVFNKMKAIEIRNETADITRFFTQNFSQEILNAVALKLNKAQEDAYPLFRIKDIEIIETTDLENNNLDTFSCIVTYYSDSIAYLRIIPNSSYYNYPSAFGKDGRPHYLKDKIAFVRIEDSWLANEYETNC